MEKWISAALAAGTLAVGAALGAALSSSTAGAQPTSPFVPGDTISLQYNGAPSRQCQVEAIAGDFVKCRHLEDQIWYNMNATLLIVRCSPLATPACK